MPEAKPNALARYRVAVQTILICYWTSMFLASHWPHVSVPDYVPNTDKILHFTGNAGFGFLIALWISTQRAFGRREFAAAFGVIFFYAIFDETTQPLTGRDCEFFDAVADWCGGLAGLSAFLAFRAIFRRLKPAGPST
ncbi:MAG TPA: VanZ family protein [Planctomycetaceae bacterium]|nr:VanZ family protein [Planctomycetaceae bacterium]